MAGVVCQRIAVIVLSAVLLFPSVAPAGVSEPPPEPRGSLSVHFFGSRTCALCREIIQEVLRPAAERHAGAVDLHLHYLEDRGAVRRMMRMEADYGVSRSSPQELFFADVALIGYDEIMARAPSLLEAYAADPETWTRRPGTRVPPEPGDQLERRVREFTILGIVAAGLVDGVNPCAIATMIFLISFLTVQKRSRGEVLWIGLSYAAAVFVTYFLLGLGAFAVVTGLEAYGLVSQIIRWVAVVFAGAVGLLSLWDALSYRRSGRTADIKLQLPQPVKLRVHRIISGNLKRSQLFTGAVTAGFLVTLLEAVCTGQVYLPTIVLMTRTTGFQLEGWLYLVLYNFLFVLPLLVVMVLAYWGLTWEKLADLTRERLALLKVAVGCLMLGLAVFLALS